MPPVDFWVIISINGVEITLDATLLLSFSVRKDLFLLGSSVSKSTLQNEQFGMQKCEGYGLKQRESSGTK